MKTCGVSKATLRQPEQLNLTSSNRKGSSLNAANCDKLLIELLKITTGGTDLMAVVEY
jgi:hypothetical protein